MADYDIDIDFGDIEEEIESAVEENIDSIGERIAEEFRDNTISELESKNVLAESNLQPLIENVSPVYEDNGEYKFNINHPSASIHEYGALSKELRNLEFSMFAYKWGDDWTKVSETVPNYKFGEGQTLPALRYLKDARSTTRKNIEKGNK